MKKFLLIAAIAVALAGCGEKEGDSQTETPKPHESTITAFGKTAQVIGDTAISTADFYTARGKLQEVMSEFDEYFNDFAESWKTQLVIIMNHDITIVIGNATPASVNGALTVGVDFLKSNDVNTIGDRLVALIDDNAFAD